MSYEIKNVGQSRLLLSSHTHTHTNTHTHTHNAKIHPYLMVRKVLVSKVFSEYAFIIKHYKIQKVYHWDFIIIERFRDSKMQQ